MLHDVAVWTMKGTPYPGVTYGTRITERLRAAGLSVLEVDAATSPTARGIAPRARAHVLSGGETPVDSPEAWMRGVQAAVATLEGETVVGICLGSQILAHVTWGPGTVGPSPQGLEMGLRALYSETEEPVAAMPLFHYHEVYPTIRGRLRQWNGHSQMQVFEPRPGWTSIQGHPELTPEDMLAVLGHSRDVVAEYSQEDYETIRKSIVDLEEQWSEETFDRLVLRPVRAAQHRVPAQRPSPADEKELAQ